MDIRSYLHVDPAHKKAFSSVTEQEWAHINRAVNLLVLAGFVNRPNYERNVDKYNDFVLDPDGHYATVRWQLYPTEHGDPRDDVPVDLAFTLYIP